MNLFIYGASDDLVEFRCLEGRLDFAIDDREGSRGGEDMRGPDKAGAEYDVNMFNNKPVIFTIGDMIKVYAIYDGTWLLAVGMVEEGTYPRWGRVETDQTDVSPDETTPKYSMCVTINSIPEDKAYIKRVA